MTEHAVASATWSVGRKTLTAFVAIAIAVIFAPAAIYLAATHAAQSTQQHRRSSDAVGAYENLGATLARLQQDSAARGLVTSRDLERSLALLEAYPRAAAIDTNTLSTLRAQLTQALQTPDPTAAAAIATTIEQHLARAKGLRDQRAAAVARAELTLYITIGAASALTFAALAWLLTCIRRDLTEREWFQRQLQESNRLLESLFENMPAMVFAKDAKTLRFVRINRVAERSIGYDREQLLGRNDHEFFPPEQADHFTATDRETLARGDIVEIPQEEIDTGDHGRRVLHTLKVPIRGPDGQPSLLLGISLDITQEKAAERRIVALNEQLTRQAQLLQSSNEELESFCYSVSHDLRAPLRAINGYARLLEQDYASRFDGQGVRYLRTICNACDRMAQLIDDLLEFSRIGRQTLELEPVDMDAVVRKVISDALAGNTGMAPHIESSALPAVDGDRTLLHLVWLNLIDNAVKYTSGVESPHIRIEAQRADAEVVYSVCDNGVGFDMQYADKLFGVFQRLHSNADYPGTGVGLAIAHRIVTRHGGRIWAHSEPGRGATFSFAMPA